MSINLWVKSYAKVNMSTQLFLKDPLNSRSKLRTLIRDNVYKHTMKENYLSNINMIQTLRTERRLNRKEVC